ncbi:MAG: hypothetical protein GXO00_02870 [Candidatus Diapherotrites archaeon]|nr:hypothetical protein [Candidatus Diapherotrites archaeon]
MNVAEIYRKHYKKMVLVPLILFAVLLFFLPKLRLGIDFTGGLSISFSSQMNVPPEEIANALKERFGVAEVSVLPVTGGYIVEMSYPPELERVYYLLEEWKRGNEAALAELNQIVPIDDVNNVDAAVTAYADRVKEEIIREIKRIVPDASNVVINDIVPTLGPEFWSLVVNISIWAVALLLLVILFYFRHPIPIVIMVVSAIFDGIAMLSLMGLSNIPLTLSTIAILLMMVGYSIDTDVIASTYLFKRIKESNPYKQAERAFLTGVTMSLTTLIAMIVIYAVGFLTRNITVIRIANVMIYGVMADLIITWMFNAPLLIWVGERRASSA